MKTKNKSEEKDRFLVIKIILFCVCIFFMIVGFLIKISVFLNMTSETVGNIGHLVHIISYAIAIMIPFKIKELPLPKIKPMTEKEFRNMKIFLTAMSLLASGIIFGSLIYFNITDIISIIYNVAMLSVSLIFTSLIYVFIKAGKEIGSNMESETNIIKRG